MTFNLSIKKVVFSVFAFMLFGVYASAQNFGYGATLRTELYSHYSNPPDGIASRSAGSAIANIGIGPKIWIGGPDFAFSPEVSVVFSPFALSIVDFKGLGAVSFPIIGKFELLGNLSLIHI